MANARLGPVGAPSVPTSAEAAAADDVARELQRRIISGEIEIGSRLRQELLAEEFGVSRMPVREALRQLQAAGIIDIVPRRGAFVRGHTPEEIRDAYVVRAELEGLAAELAAELISDAELAGLREAEAMFRTVVEEYVNRPPGSTLAFAEVSWPRANDLFHTRILAACGNQRLHDTVVQLHGSFPRNLTWAAISESSSLLRRNAAEHNEILEAIAKGDGAAARRAAKRHVLRSGDLVASRYQKVTGAKS